VSLVERVADALQGGGFSFELAVEWGGAGQAAWRACANGRAMLMLLDTPALAAAARACARRLLSRLPTVDIRLAQALVTADRAGAAGHAGDALETAVDEAMYVATSADSPESEVAWVVVDALHLTRSACHGCPVGSWRLRLAEDARNGYERVYGTTLPYAMVAREVRQAVPKAPVLTDPNHCRLS